MSFRSCPTHFLVLSYFNSWGFPQSFSKSTKAWNDCWCDFIYNHVVGSRYFSTASRPENTIASRPIFYQGSKHVRVTRRETREEVKDMVPPWLQTLQVTDNLEIKLEPGAENSNKILMHNFQSTVFSHNIIRWWRTSLTANEDLPMETQTHTQCENGGGCEMSHPRLKLNHLLRTDVTPPSLSFWSGSSTFTRYGLWFLTSRCLVLSHWQFLTLHNHCFPEKISTKLRVGSKKQVTVTGPDVHKTIIIPHKSSRMEEEHAPPISYKRC